MNHQHPWKLVGPWYRWHDPESAPLPQPQPAGRVAHPELGRSSRPILQKYATPKFVDEFLKDPQRCLRFDQTDFVYEPVNGVYRKSEPNRRKVFLNTHQRFYLVVCELHCDTVGFPTVARDQVCEAGFVVRRRRVPIPAEAKAKFETAVAKRARANFQWREVQRKTRRGAAGIIAGMTRAAQEREAEKYKVRYGKAQEELDLLIDQYQIQRQTEGWVPSPTEGIGEWQAVDEAPAELFCTQTTAAKESCYPLYPLIPDPAARDHSSERRSLWFGVLPTGAAEVTETGQPRFTDRHVYEVRCFVRRHRAQCPRKSARNDCGGELVWSAATEPFRLAAQFDLQGTSHRQVTIQVPDLRALEAQVNSPEFQLGQGVGVAMVTPRDSELNFDVDEDGKPIPKGRGAGASVCFFAIPLITIVAMFVLRLFLPIVVFLFQLWFLLLLKFCLPPMFSLEAGLAADLEAALDGELAIDGQLEADLLANVSANLGGHVGAQIAADLSSEELARTALELSSDFSGEAPEDLAGELEAPHLPPPLTGQPANRPRPLPRGELVYYQRVYSEPRA